MVKKLISFYLILPIIVLALLLRLYDVNWDQDHHLHPDERFLTMVTNGIMWPENIFEYFNTSSSPLNPHNRNFGLFVYGTFPIFLTKLVGESFKMGDYNKITIVGRVLSALVDMGTLFVVFFVSKIIALRLKQEKPELKKLSLFPLAATLFYAISVLPIQLSHFYAVDTYANFFANLALLITVVLLIKERNVILQGLLSLFLGLTIGLAFASKISSISVLPVIAFAFLFSLIIHKRFLKLLINGFIIVLSSFVSIRIFQPYAFSGNSFFTLAINPKFLDNLKTLESYDSPKAMFPPAVQWLNTPSFIFPFKNLLLWGLGIPITILSLLGICYVLSRFLKEILKNIRNKELKIPDKFTSNIIFLLFFLFSFILFVYQGSRYTKNMRYFIFVYPTLCIFGGYFLYLIYSGEIFSKLKEKIKIIVFIILLTLIWPVSFFAVYQRPHSRVMASRWIFDNILPNSTLTYEHWDDPLPLGLPDKDPQALYKYVELPLYDPDVLIKWEKVVAALDKADYIVMSSNRLWGSIPRAPERYPLAPYYYQALFDGSLGFKKIADITSDPCFPLAKMCLLRIDDSWAEESFTVYDHPRILIYRKHQLNRKLLNTWINESKKIKP